MKLQQSSSSIHKPQFVHLLHLQRTMGNQKNERSDSAGRRFSAHTLTLCLSPTIRLAFLPNRLPFYSRHEFALCTNPIKNIVITAERTDFRHIYMIN
jgi:hypothetical protein